ncbi:MAG: tRNA (adenosine(37)-N6)-threonylcarbamoyltransferase complex transferase subunit TsaD [Planctomycetes bacterium]|nr:tRNA (adenosine(37)-N6)-threonylcarbamoyltransferase complex transferase subunit TsaD [Planctomycetota bacterium]
MLVLGVESSCDETAVALVEDGRVLSSAVRSQIERHAPFGGVVPDIAARAHSEVIDLVADEAFRAAGRTPAQVDAVAATRAPGLVNCLVVGLSWGKAFAVARDVPFVAIDHLEAHVHACTLPPPGAAAAPDVEPPLVALLASGGHTGIYRYDGPGQVRRLGRTVDDAAGEAFDKVAILLGLPYPGGPHVEQAARAGDPTAYDFPRARVKRRKYDVSFSGLKTAVLYGTRGRNQPKEAPLLPGTSVADVAASFQEAVCDLLVDVTVEAALEEGVSTIALGGGVACNGRLRALARERGEAQGLRVVLTPPAYCTDNAAMVAALAAARLRASVPGDDELARSAEARSELA